MDTDKKEVDVKKMEKDILDYYSQVVKVAQKILLIDDEPDFLETVSSFLTERGFEVTTAGDGEEGLLQFDLTSPQLILLDLSMPKKDGFEFLKYVREKKAWVPIIIVSALADPKDVLKGYDLEADYYLTKPVNLERLHKAVQVMFSWIPLRKK